jgi:hypothetical protein
MEVIIYGQRTIWDEPYALRYIGIGLKIDNGYLRRAHGKKEYVHREIMDAGPDDYVDHINGNRLDNRRANLRICTQSENMRNQGLRSNNKSGTPGIHFCKTRRRWVAQIKVNGKQRLLGRFLDRQDALAARLAGEEKYFGEFAASKGVLEDIAQTRQLA